VEVTDEGAKEPGSGVGKAVLAGDLEVELAVGSGYGVVADGFSGSAGRKTDVLRKNGGEVLIH
jgi:hypothetical protein